MIGDIDVFFGKNQGTFLCRSMKGTLLVLQKSQFMKIKKISNSWTEVLGQIGMKKFRIKADDIN